MGLVDGPGVRVVIFMQGCPLRCLYCHNPEMQEPCGGTETTPNELLTTILKYQNYFSNNGGVTFSGGEPLLQLDFLKEVLKLCKENNIHTCIDTSGGANFDDQLLDLTDLIILDIKALEETSYKNITNYSINQSLNFLKRCQELNKKMWLRSVIIPTINDNNNYIDQLGLFINKLSNIEKVELLPYHSMAKSKYEDLNLEYKLEDINDMDISKLKQLDNRLQNTLQKKD